MLGLVSLTQVSAYSAEPIEVILVTPVPGQGVAGATIAGNVQTATADEIARSHAPDLASFLNRTLGSVFINDIQNNPFQGDVNYRGFTASPLLGTAQGLSVYIDGVRQNQPFGDVVNWDLIPQSAIASVTLMPGSNPLFGLNTLGGALNVQTKDGLRNPGTEVEAVSGQFGRRSLQLQHGGSSANGLHWFAAASRFHDDGWRQESPSDIRQLFGKLGIDGQRGSAALTLAWSNNDLYGNGMQEQRLLAVDRTSVYTRPDETYNGGMQANLLGSWRLNEAWTLEGNVYGRYLENDTENADINDESLDQSVYQPNATERAALAAAGFSGFPVSGENAGNTPFPKWRCIAQSLLRDEPGEKCNGIINTAASTQRNYGFNLQAITEQQGLGVRHRVTIGAAIDRSNVDFSQGSELGYLNAWRSVVGTGAVADGVRAGDIDGVPMDNRIKLDSRSHTRSLFALDTIALNVRAALTLSARYNHTQVDSLDGIKSAGGTGSLNGEHTYSHFNSGLGFTWQFDQGLTAYAGANQGSRAPSAIELGCADPDSPCKFPNAMAGDPPLKQVLATTVEAGLRHNGDMRWNVGVFRTDSRDDILFVCDDMAGYGYFRNFGSTRRQGLELGVETTLGQWQLAANYSWTDATYRSMEMVNGSSNSSNEEAALGLPGVDGAITIVKGMQMPLIPEHLFKVSARWALTPALSINADMTAVAGTFARGNENNAHQPDGVYYLGKGRTAGYAVMNLGAEWQAMPRLTVFAQVNNLLDRDYLTASQLSPTGFDVAGNFVARPFPANREGERPLLHSTFQSPGAPRTAWVGLQYRL